MRIDGLAGRATEGGEVAEDLTIACAGNGGADRHRFEPGQRRRRRLGHTDIDEILHPAARIEPVSRCYLAAAAQCEQHRIGHVSFR